MTGVSLVFDCHGFVFVTCEGRIWATSMPVTSVMLPVFWQASVTEQP